MIEDRSSAEAGVYRRPLWIIILIAVGLVMVLAGVCAMTPAGSSLVDSLRIRLQISQPLVRPTGQPAGATIPAATTTPTATIPPTTLSATTAAPSEAPTATANAKATLTPTREPKASATLDQATCQCQGTDYVCRDGKTSYNDTRCGGSGRCECRGTDLYCPDGTVSKLDVRCVGTAVSTVVGTPIATLIDTPLPSPIPTLAPTSDGGSTPVPTTAACTCVNVVCNPLKVPACVGVCRETGLPCFP